MKQKMIFLSSGRMAEVYTWGESKILKLNKAMFSKAVAEKEYQITHAAHQAGIPVPEAYEVIELDGRFGIIFDRIDGKTLLDELSAKPWKVIVIARQLARLHVQIHSCQAESALPGQKNEMIRSIDAAECLSESDKGRVKEYLSKMPDGRSFCHGDFHPGNVLMSERGPIIIDWLTGTTGDPLADVCRTEMIMRTSGVPENTPTVTRVFITLFKSLFCRVYLREYRRLKPFTSSDLNRWSLLISAARLREVKDYKKEETLLLKKIKYLI